MKDRVVFFGLKVTARALIFREIKTEPSKRPFFYKAMKELEELKVMVLESIEEHKQVKNLLVTWATLVLSDNFKAN